MCSKTGKNCLKKRLNLWRFNWQQNYLKKKWNLALERVLQYKKQDMGLGIKQERQTPSPQTSKHFKKKRHGAVGMGWDTRTMDYFRSGEIEENCAGYWMNSENSGGNPGCLPANQDKWILWHRFRRFWWSSESPLARALNGPGFRQPPPRLHSSLVTLPVRTIGGGQLPL